MVIQSPTTKKIIQKNIVKDMTKQLKSYTGTPKKGRNGINEKQKDIGHIENNEQNSKYKSYLISNYIRCK